MIRLMEHKDIYVLIEMGANMHAESNYAPMDYSNDKVYSFFDTIIENDSCLGLVSESDGDITGFFVGMAEEHFFGRDLMSIDLLLYVNPDQRGGTAAYRLLNAYIDWAKELGVKEIKIGITTGVHEEQTARLYNKCNFERCGSLFIYKGD